MRIGMYGGFDNGLVKDTSIDYIAIDQGLTYLSRQNIKPLIAIGDFDSLEDKSLLDGIDHLDYNPVKDDTDTAIALKWAIDHGYDEIDIYGVMQGRMDHFLAVLCLLQKYASYKITLYDQGNVITLFNKGTYEIDCKDHTYFSVFALNETLLTLKNCEYELDQYCLKKDDPLCVSNRCLDTLHLETTDQIIFIKAS